MEEDNLSRVASGKLSGSPGCICDRVYGLSMILNWDERKVLEKCKNGYDWIWGGWFCFSRIVWFLENKGAKLWFIMKLEFNHFKISVRVLKISFRSPHFLQYVLQNRVRKQKGRHQIPSTRCLERQTRGPLQAWLSLISQYPLLLFATQTPTTALSSSRTKKKSLKIFL